MKHLELTLCPGPGSRVEGDTALVLIPLDERPLGGEAGRFDWRLCGEISSLLESGYASGSSGESMLIPAGAAVAPRRLLLFGLGQSKHLGARRIEQAVRRAAGKAIELAAEDLILALPGSLQLEVDAEAILSGLLLALDQADTAQRLHVLVPEPEGPERALERAAEALQEEAGSRSIELLVRRDAALDSRLMAELA
jgi:hypothetical protein